MSVKKDIFTKVRQAGPPNQVSAGCLQNTASSVNLDKQDGFTNIRDVQCANFFVQIVGNSLNTNNVLKTNLAQFLFVVQIIHAKIMECVQCQQKNSVSRVFFILHTVICRSLKIQLGSRISLLCVLCNIVQPRHLTSIILCLVSL